MDVKEYESLQRRLESLRDFKAQKMAEMRNYQDQLKDLKERVSQDYGVPLEGLEAYAQAEEQKFQAEMEDFKRALQEAESIRSDIEQALT